MIPHYQPSESALIGPYPHNRRMVGKRCKIIRVLEPIFGEYRYSAEVDGVQAIFLEGTLRKVLQGSDWSEIADIWQPRREAR